MEMIEFGEILNEYLEEMKIELQEKQIEEFYKYMNLLLEWNEKINLTAITEPNDVILKHFVDSITISKYIEKYAMLVDVGTGAGFPGIPIKILRPDVKVVLVDSLNKRINFLNEVIKELDLQNIETVHARAEEFGRNKKYRETFDIATSRAVANFSTLSEYLIPLIKENGKVIYMKGSDVKEELENAQKAIKVLGGKIVGKEEFYLPKSDIKRNIIIVKKVEKTPARYPRKPGTPAKEPIQ